MSRIFLEKVRYLLSNAHSSKNIWVEIVHIAYLINKSPCSLIECKTSKETWSERTPSYGHLRVFGCIGHIHINEGKLQHRRKMMSLWDTLME